MTLPDHNQKQFRRDPGIDTIAGIGNLHTDHQDVYRVLILTAPSGHLTLARAVKSYIEDLPRLKIETMDLVGQHFEWELFRFVYQYVPFIMKVPFVLTSNLEILQIAKDGFRRRLETTLSEILEKEKPDLVINTYHGYIPALDLLKEKYPFKYVNSITDPVSLHPILFSLAADYNVGFDEDCQVFGQRLEIPKERIIPSGWFTDPSFFKTQPTAKIRRKLGLKEQLTIMCCAGSQGNDAVLFLLPALLLTKYDREFQVIFITGHNQALEKAIQGMYQLAAKHNPNVPKIVVIGFTDQMSEYMAVADVIIGKAGPNLIFESVASGKPFVAISHIGGNEDGNLDMIRQHNLGWVAEDPILAGKIIKEIIQNPQVLSQKKPGLKKMAAKCSLGGMFVRRKVMEWNA